jgi:hypothetical protein
MGRQGKKLGGMSHSRPTPRRHLRTGQMGTLLEQKSTGFCYAIVSLDLAFNPAGIIIVVTAASEQR